MVFFSVQVRVQAADDGVPSKKNDTTFVITIKRNLERPVITSPSIVTVNIPETQDLGVPIYTITASDADTQVNNILCNIKIV